MKSKSESALEILLCAVKGARIGVVMAWVLEYGGVTQRFDEMLDKCRSIRVKK